MHEKENEFSVVVKDEIGRWWGGGVDGGVGSNVVFSSETQPASVREKKALRERSKEAGKKEGSEGEGEVWREGDMPNDNPPHF